MQHFSMPFVLLILQLIAKVQSSDISNISWPVLGARAKLEIWPELVGAEFDQKLLLHKKDEPLNMTCTVVYPPGEQNDKISNYTVDWKLPLHVKNNKETKIEHGQGHNMAWLWFERLSETYAGDYKCMAITSPPNKILSIKIHLSVKHNKHKITYCNPLWFKCHSSNRIPNRYLCDGKADCEEGEDETMEAGCGPDPCADKIFCGDRCIPSEWCCDQYNYLYNCSLKSYTRPNEAIINPTYNDISFLQATTYVLIGCAMIFILIFTVLVIAICRLQMKRAMACRLSEQFTFRSQRRVPFHDLDIYFSRTSDTNNVDDSEITYNISSEVPLTSPEPPPYSEIVFAMCNEDLPPPYESNEDLLYPGMTGRSILTRMDSSPESISPLQASQHLRKGNGNAETRMTDNESCGANGSIIFKPAHANNPESSARCSRGSRSNEANASSSKTTNLVEASDENVFTQAEHKSLLRMRQENKLNDESDGLNVSRCCNVERTRMSCNEENVPDAAETVQLLRPDVDGISCQVLQMSSTMNDEFAENAILRPANLDSSTAAYNDE